MQKRPLLNKLNRLYTKIAKGSVVVRGTKIPKMTIVGILGVIFMYIGVAGMVSTATPWLERGDTRQHVDYIWRVYKNHDIPRWSDRLQYPPFVKIYGSKPQAASANPPLFYLIHSPFVGPLLKQLEWEKAILIGRTINIFIGILCIIALSWAGWLFGGARKELFAVAVPALSVLMFRFTRLNVDYALDVLLVLFATLALINAHKIISRGLKLKYVIAAAIVSVLGMSTKATYVIPLAVTLLSIVVAVFFHNNKNLKKNLIKASSIVAAILILVILAIGWFYYLWNYKSTGSWFSPFPEGYTGGRTPKSFIDVISSSDLWRLWYGSFSSYGISIAMSSMALAGYFATKKTRYIVAFKNKIFTATLIILILLLIGSFVTQIVHAVGIGSINFRYLLPALLPVGLYLSYGLLEFKWTRGQLVSVFAIAMGTSTLLGLGVLSRHRLYAVTLANGIPIHIPKLLILAFFFGAIVLSTSLFILTSKYTTGNKS